MNKANITVTKHSLEQAAEWLMKSQEAPLSAEEQEQLEQWQKASPDNTRAWLRAQRLMGHVETLPKDIAAAVLNRPDDENRRFAIGNLSLLLAAGPVIWGSYKTVETQQWTADYRTATGEVQEVTLPDGSLVKLNTATAFDMKFDRHSRLLTLREGEIQLQTPQVNTKEFGPFLIQTHEGMLSPLGTILTVRQNEGITQLAAIKGKVKVTPRLATTTDNTVIQSGYQAELSSYALLSNQLIAPETNAWLDQMLAANKMPLKQFAQEVSRYRHGFLRVSPKIENLMVSGAFPTSNTDIIINMLTHTYPIKAKRHMGGYWITLEPA
ncbi:FecR family protein [Marinomonas primoryensis]|uniref:Periplasmic ferric-dicitrate-binding protein FecR n=1 Tax=Marinomonas primoryensis TaxID=178399 RepID=A0A859D478_9GAMM|nr:FecR domain-containing protein [Marinomonas primoryensis]QKK82080.1 periplasmic ferric-dicitrate-binding protein FecR [Marinomonas primoryensis]